MLTIAIVVGVLVTVGLIAAGVFYAVTHMFIKVEQGKALIVSRTRKVDVTFTGTVVLPFTHRAELMDISVKTIDIQRTGRDGLICRDNIRADIRITFFVRVNKTQDDVIKVAQAIGTERASSKETLQELFAAKFSEALKTVGKHLDFVDLYTRRNDFRDQIVRVIGTDLNGYSLEDAAIDYLEQTPMSQLDAQNILDAQGIRKITELTAIEHVRTNELRRHEEQEITRQNVDAQETILELQRRQADAQNTQQREVETMRAREEAETARVQAEEKLKADSASLRVEEELGVQRENLTREVAVAAMNRERVVTLEAERIERARLLEVVARERETELAGIAKDKDVEVEKRLIAEVIRERIATERTVAEKEEEIKLLRMVQEAERDRRTLLIRAEAEAQQGLVKDLKAAEAAEKAAEYKAREEQVLAEARGQTAEIETKAKIRLAEGVQAELAAPGLAEVAVQERREESIEKVGRAEAAVETAKARAEGTLQRERLEGEAKGLAAKAEAMAALNEASRGHEEFRLQLEAKKEVQLADLDAQGRVAEAQASVLAAAMEHADVNIVGGDGTFLDRLTGSIALGKSVDGFVENSAVAGALVERILALLTKLIGEGGPKADKLREMLVEMLPDDGMGKS
jgi:uncharacterized membrane protein YqiK